MGRISSKDGLPYARVLGGEGSIISGGHQQTMHAAIGGSGGAESTNTSKRSEHSDKHLVMSWVQGLGSRLCAFLSPCLPCLTSFPCMHLEYKRTATMTGRGTKRAPPRCKGAATVTTRRGCGHACGQYLQQHHAEGGACEGGGEAGGVACEGTGESKLHGRGRGNRMQGGHSPQGLRDLRPRGATHDYRPSNAVPCWGPETARSVCEHGVSTSLR